MQLITHQVWLYVMEQMFHLGHGYLLMEGAFDVDVVKLYFHLLYLNRGTPLSDSPAFS